MLVDVSYMAGWGIDEVNSGKLVQPRRRSSYLPPLAVAVGRGTDLRMDFREHRAHVRHPKDWLRIADR